MADPKLCPREPTIEMLVAGRKQTFADMTGEHLGPSAENTWKAMFDAAPASTLEDQARLIGECREVVDDAKAAIEAATASFVFGEPTQGFLYATHDKLDALLTKLNAFERAR